MERDLGYSFVLSRARDISTHTLTWSVTDVEYGKATDFRISTHTLTWSVTGNNRTAPNVHVSISTHTLTWSVTNCHAEMVSSHRHFNSHAHVERDIRPLRLSQKDRISTHTLTWSVTTLLIWQNLTIEFQLTRSRGA